MKKSLFALSFIFKGTVKKLWISEKRLAEYKLVPLLLWPFEPSALFLFDRQTGQTFISFSLFQLKGELLQPGQGENWKNVSVSKLNSLKAFKVHCVTFYLAQWATSLGRILRYLEMGMWSRLSQCTDESSRTSCRLSEISVFESLDEYIEEYSGFSDLELENFRFLFLYYALACLLTFTTFITHHLVKFIRKMHFFVQSVLVGCFVRSSVLFGKLNRYWPRSWMFSTKGLKSSTWNFPISLRFRKSCLLYMENLHGDSLFFLFRRTGCL